MVKLCRNCAVEFESGIPGTRYCSEDCRFIKGVKHRKDGYLMRYVPAHPLANDKGYVLDHVLVAEKALGHYLPPKAVVHHVDESRDINERGNLVICENQAYHMILHARQRVLNAGGDPDTDKICSRCQTVKIKHSFCANASAWDGLHPDCRPCKRIRENERVERRRQEAEARSAA